MSFDDWGDDDKAGTQQKENVSPNYSSTRTNDDSYHQNSLKKADNRDNTAVDDDWGDSPTTQGNNSANDRPNYRKSTQQNTAEDSWGNEPSDRRNDRQGCRDSGYSDNPYYSNYRKSSQDNQGGRENWDDRYRGTGPLHNNQGHYDRQSPDDNHMGGSERQANVYVPDLDDSGFDVFNQGNNVGGNFSQFKNIPINVSGPNAPTKVDSFEQSGLSEPVLKNIKRCNYSMPTPCQSYSIPTILARRDLICCAHTGSGKTAAFILPLLDLFTQDQATNATEDHPYKAFPKVLILSPTRELTIQTYHNFKKFASNTPIKAKMCYGGTTNKFQMDHLKNGCDFLIATVGRLLDLIRRNVISLVSTRYIVLDEADRMLDMGFFEEVQNILSMCVSRDKQTMMYSATFPKELQEIAYKFLAKDYIFIAIGKVGSVNPDISQKILQTDNMSKLQLIQDELSGLKNSKVLIFVRTKKTADFLAAKLSMSDFSATSIHGDRLQVFHYKIGLLFLAEYSSLLNFLPINQVTARAGPC
ncbi:MAG: putative ATP-dependent RNA helicase ddx4 [Marteilia pararefringens]